MGWLREVAAAGSSFNKLELWRTLTTTQDGREYLSLPTGLPIRRVILQVYPDRDATHGIEETSPANVLNELKLSYKNGQLAIFDGNIADLWRQNRVEFGFDPLVHGSTYHTADFGFDIGLGDVRGFAAISGARDNAVSAVIPTREGDQSACTQKLEVREDDSPVDYIARGLGYQNCGVFRYDRAEGGADLLDPSERGMGVVEMELHTRNAASAADGTIRVILDRVATARQVTV